MNQGEDTGTPIGMVGCGLLGNAIGRRLLSSGHDVLGWDPSISACAAWEGIGGRVAETTDDIVRTCPIVLVAVLDDSQVESLASLWGASDSRVTTVVQVTTGDPDQASARAQRLASQGVDWVDAAVAGSSTQVVDGEAMFLVGATDRGWKAAVPLLSAVSNRVHRTGVPGDGMRAKLVFNHFLGLQRAVLAETLALARGMGLSPMDVFSWLEGSPADATVLRSKGPRMVERDFAPAARLSQHAKDVDIVLSLAERCGIALPLAQVHSGLLAAVIEAGHGDDDNAAVIRWWDAMPKDGGTG